MGIGNNLRQLYDHLNGIREPSIHISLEDRQSCTLPYDPYSVEPVQLCVGLKTGITLVLASLLLMFGSGTAVAAPNLQGGTEACSRVEQGTPFYNCMVRQGCTFGSGRWNCGGASTYTGGGATSTYVGPPDGGLSPQGVKDAGRAINNVGDMIGGASALTGFPGAAAFIFGRLVDDYVNYRHDTEYGLPELLLQTLNDPAQAEQFRRITGQSPATGSYGYGSSPQTAPQTTGGLRLCNSYWQNLKDMEACTSACTGVYQIFPMRWSNGSLMAVCPSSPQTAPQTTGGLRLCNSYWQNLKDMEACTSACTGVYQIFPMRWSNGSLMATCR